MPRKLQFKKADAKRFAKQLAEDVADYFDVTPEIEEDATPGDWEYRLGRVRVWTKAGPARMSIDVSATFAHMYFQFDDVARAKALGLHGGAQRLNPHSGKWNNWHAPDAEIELSHFREELVYDFQKVAEPNPAPEDVAAFEAKQRAEDAQWAAWRAELAAAKAIA